MAVSGLTACSLTFGALQLGEFPVKPRARIPKALLDFVDVGGLEGQPVDDLLGHMAGMIGQAFRTALTGQFAIGAKAVGAVIVDDPADAVDEWLPSSPSNEMAAW